MKDILFPNWLASEHFTFDIHQILEDSCYYPYGNYQGAPVKHLIKKVYSFVFIEYGATQAELLNEIAFNGFKGYKVIHEQEITQAMLTPNGLVSFIQPRLNDDYVPVNPKPFCKWYIFENKEENLRFSLLFLTADAVAAYQALYFSNKVNPRIVVFAYPRGNNRVLQNHWRELSREVGFFERVLLSNSQYSPDYISFDEQVWNSYSDFVESIYVNYQICKRKI